MYNFKHFLNYQLVNCEIRLTIVNLFQDIIQIKIKWTLDKIRQEHKSNHQEQEKSRTQAIITQPNTTTLKNKNRYQMLNNIVFIKKDVQKYSKVYRKE